MQIQHYVPRFLQRNWGVRLSTSEKRPGHVLKYIRSKGDFYTNPEAGGNEKLRNLIPISDNWSEPGFYGDTENEKLFGKAEREWSIFVDDIVKEKHSLIDVFDESWEFAKLGIAYQYLRTDYTASQIGSMIGKIMDKLIEVYDHNVEDDCRRLELPKGFSNTIEFETDPVFARMLSIHSIKVTIASMANLKYMILESPNHRILLPDTGICYTNIHALLHVPQLSCVLSSMGAILISPISPRKALLFWDSVAYSSDHYDQLEYKMTTNDEINLAHLIMHHSEEMLYYPTFDGFDWFYGVRSSFNEKFIRHQDHCTIPALEPIDGFMDMDGMNTFGNTMPVRPNIPEVYREIFGEYPLHSE